MSDTVIVAVLSLIGTLGGTLGGILVSNKLTVYRIEQLEAKVAAHNNVIDRTYKLETDAAVFHEEMKVANRRIADLEAINRNGV